MHYVDMKKFPKNLVFRLVQGRLLLLDNLNRLLKSSMSYFPLVLWIISKLKCILLLHQNFGKLNLWMQISFIILFMIDLYKDNHVRAYVCAFVYFFFKKSKI